MGFSPRGASAPLREGEAKARLLLKRRLKPTVRGVTLIELLIVVTIMGVVAGLSFSTAAAGLDSLRLRSASGQVLSFLEIALDRAERRQQVVELVISPAENALRALSGDASFDRTLVVPEPVRIVTVEPPLVNAQGPEEQRRFLLYPGGTLPRIAIDLITKDGRKRQVLVDPVTGFAHAEAP